MEEYIQRYGINPLDIFGLQQNYTLKQLKRRYVDKALILHPDKTGGVTKVEFNIVKDAYNCLLEDYENNKLLTNGYSRKNTSREEIIPEKVDNNYTYFLEDKMNSVSIKPIGKPKYTGLDVKHPKINMKDFHKVFQYYKNKYEKTTDGTVVRMEDIEAYSNLKDYSEVYSYNGILVDQSVEELDAKNLQEYNSLFRVKGPDNDQYASEKHLIDEFVVEEPVYAPVKGSKYKNIDMVYETGYNEASFNNSLLQQHKDTIMRNKERVYKDPRISNRLLEQAANNNLEVSTLREDDIKGMSSFQKRLMSMDSKPV